MNIVRNVVLCVVNVVILQILSLKAKDNAQT